MDPGLCNNSLTVTTGIQNSNGSNLILLPVIVNGLQIRKKLQVFTIPDFFPVSIVNPDIRFRELGLFDCEEQWAQGLVLQSSRRVGRS